METGDKTFLLTFLFCLILQHDNAAHQRGYNSNLSIAIRIFLSSVVGICLVMTYSVLQQKQIYAYETNAVVAVVLLLTLIYYLHMICKVQLTSLALEEHLESMSLKFKQNKRKTIEIIQRVKTNQKNMSIIKEEQREIILGFNKGVVSALEEITQQDIIGLQMEINNRVLS